VERHVRDGDPSEEILAVARETRSDLIVMGTHGRTGVGRLLMGSVAEQVMRRATCPVLTVKTPVPEVAPAAEMAETAHA
jgi:nucleotide-binding universal stress UspA family protein